MTRNIYIFCVLLLIVTISLATGSSPSLDIWNKITDGWSGGNWQSIAYGNGVHVAVGYASGQVKYSTNGGLTWTLARSKLSTNQDIIQNVLVYRVRYLNEQFVAVGPGYVFVGRIVESSGTKSVDFTSYQIKNSEWQWRDVAYGNGVYVIVARYNTNGAYVTREIVATSSDNGNTWVERKDARPEDQQLWQAWNGVTFGNGKFVAVGEGMKHIMTSTDGITWTVVEPPNAVNGGTMNFPKFQSVAYGNGKFVAVAWSHNSEKQIAYSTDCINWYEVTQTPFQDIDKTMTLGHSDWTHVRFLHDRFIAMNAQGQIMYSTSGNAGWIVAMPQHSNTAFTVQWKDIAFGSAADSGGNRFIGIGHNEIMLSELEETAAPTHSPTASPNVNPTPSPNVNPTPSPNVNPTPLPTTKSPTLPGQTYAPTSSPTIAPTKAPTFCPMNTQNGQEYTRFDSCTDQGALITTINFETQVGPNECARRCRNEILPIGHCKSGAYNSQQKTCKLFNIQCNLQAYDQNNNFIKTFYCHSAIAPTSSPNNPPTSSPNNSPTSSPNNSPTSPTAASTVDEGSSDSVGTIIGVSVGVLAFAGVAYITFKKKKIPGVYGSDVETAT